MTVYDAMTLFENAREDEHEVPERPMLHITTPEVTPKKALDPGFDWDRWDAHANIKPASPQSLPSLDHASPTSEDLSSLPKCQKCGLTTKQHDQVKLFICGHLCRDIPQEKFCPDIDALNLSSKDCPIHSPKKKGLTRRRSSLSKPPMLARDETTYKDLDVKQISPELTESPVEKNEISENTKQIQDEQSKAPNKPTYHVSRDAQGDADWRKHCRVEKAMQQMLFGDARVSAHIMLEHTQRLRGNENISTAQKTRDDEAEDELRSAIAVAKIEAEKHAHEGKERGAKIRESNTELDSFKAAQAQSRTHNLNCAICSGEEGEEEEEEFQGAISTARSATKAHGCASDDECRSYTKELDPSVDSREFTPEEGQQMWMDQSRAC